VKEINDREIFYLPNALNPQTNHFIKYGQNSIGNILAQNNKYMEESMLHQLEKLELEDRKFVYYIKKNHSRYRQRDYTIHFNLQKDARSRDILKSYFLGRLIDKYIQATPKETIEGGMAEVIC